MSMHLRQIKKLRLTCSKRTQLFLTCMLYLFFLPCMVLALPVQDSLVPAGLSLQKGYQPGKEQVIGKLTFLQGTGIIYHGKEPVCFLLRQGLDLYSGDTIVTGKKSSAGITLCDQSIITLDANTRLTLSKAIFDPDTRFRSSFINLFLGKARFWIKKLKDFKESEFKVRTKTALAGVRGSDFIILALKTRTEITALEDTTLEVISLAFPSQPIFLHDFQRTRIDLGQLPTKIEEIPEEELLNLKKGLKLRRSNVRFGTGGQVPDFKELPLATELPGIDQDMEKFTRQAINPAEQDIQQEQQQINQEQIKEQQQEELPVFPGHP